MTTLTPVEGNPFSSEQAKQPSLTPVNFNPFEGEPKLEEGVAERVAIGVGSGVVSAGEGIGQFSRQLNVDGNRELLERLQASGKVPEQALREVEAQLSRSKDELFDFNESTLDRREEFSESPVGKTTAAKVGSFIGETIPGMAIPGGAGKTILGRLASNAGINAGVSSTSFVDESEGQSRLDNALTGAAFAAVPAGLEKAAPSITNGLRSIFRGGSSDTLQKNISNFAEVGATPSVGVGTEGVTAQGIESISSKFFGGSKLRKSIEDVTEKVSARLDGIASDINPRAGDVATSGRVIREGILGEGGFISRFKGKESELWGEVDRLVDGRIVNIGNTNAALKEIVDGGAISKFLTSKKITSLKSLLDGRELEYSDVKELRSFIGEALSGGGDILPNTSRSQLKRIYGALSEDISVAADAAGAAKAFARANNHTRAGHKRVDEFVERITKKADPEDVFKLVTRGSESASTINAIKRSLKPDEWESVAATVIKRLGKSNDGLQNADGDVFSVGKFLTDWNKLGEAKSAMFSGSKKLNEYRANLDRIAKVSERMKESSRELSNASGSGIFAANAGLVGGSVVTAATGNFEVAAGLVALVGANKSAAALMTSPKFVNWLAQTSRVKPSALGRHIGRLGAISSSSGNDVALGIQELLFTLAPQQDSQNQEE